jgi:hypothetical protein
VRCAWLVFVLVLCSCLMCCGVQVSDVFGDAGGAGPAESASTTTGGSHSSPASSASGSGGAEAGAGGASGGGGFGPASSSSSSSAGGSSGVGSGGAGGEGGGPACVCGNLFPCAEAHCAAACPNATGCLSTYPYVCSDDPDTCDPCVEHFCRCYVNACAENP